MTPLFFTLENNLALKIIPDTRVHMDGHPILSYNYSIFLNTDKEPLKNIDKPSEVDINDPDYMGYITFEQPGKLFTYTAVQGHSLAGSEVEEVIEYLSHIRDNPPLWKTTGEF